MLCQGQGIVPWDYTLHGRDVVPKECFCKAVFPKEHFLDADWSVIKTTKMADKLEKHSPFRQKQTFCILIKVFCW